MRSTDDTAGEHAVARLLTRLDDVARALAARGDGLALLGLGSTGQDRRRLDAHSDLDVFLVVEDDAVERYRSDGSWWTEVAPVAFAFAHTSDGWKVLFEDGVFVESAVFSVAELQSIPFSGARTVWQRPGAPQDLAVPRTGPPRAYVPSNAHQVGEALTNLYVGLHRLERGEVLSATRFIQGSAVDRVLNLLERTDPSGRSRQDPFAVERSAETQHAGRDLPLADLVPGYARNAEAAAALLAWLRRNVPQDVDPAMAAAVQELLDRRPG